MKKAYILHGWGGSPQGSFKPWLKKELEKQGFQVEIPVLPNTDTPKMSEWLPYIEQLVGTPDENTVLVSHSLSGLAVLQYLAALPEETRFHKIIFVAPVVDQIMDMTDAEKKIAKPWLEAAIDSQKIQRFSKYMTAFFSDNDVFIPAASAEVMKGKYSAKTIMLHNRGHFDDASQIKEVPEILEEIIKA